MPASSSELTYARTWIGTKETDDVFDERIDRLDSSGVYDTRDNLVNAAIAESLRSQLASMMLDRPGQASVGSVSYSNATNIQELSKMLKAQQAQLGGGATARLVRPRRR